MKKGMVSFRKYVYVIHSSDQLFRNNQMRDIKKDTK